MRYRVWKWSGMGHQMHSDLGWCYKYRWRARLAKWWHNADEIRDEKP